MEPTSFNPVVFLFADNQTVVVLTVIVCAIAGLFAILHIIAAISQLRKGYKLSHLLMLCGGIDIIGAIINCIDGRASDWFWMLAGGALVCAAAIMNGRAAGKLNPLHHIIRGLLALALSLAFFFL